jgi:hypothetical protein
MTFNWLESKVVSTLFFCSAAYLLIIWAFVLTMNILRALRFWTSSEVSESIAMVFFAAVILAMASSLILFFGMVVCCVCMKRHSIGTKVLWFVLFLMTGFIGSVVYYFTVYRRHVKTIRTANLTLQNLQP